MEFTKWEYKISSPGMFEDSIDHMNVQGQRGWESCGVSFNKQADIVEIVWKRPID